MKHCWPTIAATVAVALAVAGCAKKSTSSARPQTASETKGASAAPGPTSAPTPPERRPRPKLTLETEQVDEATAKSPAKLGIAECDEYIEKQYRCVTTKVPADARPISLKGLHNLRASWAAARERGMGVPWLQTACVTALTTSEDAMKAYGCVF